MLQESLRLQGSPISYPLNVSTLPTKGRTVIVQPDEAACEKLADEMDVLAVDGLRAAVTVSRWQRDGVRLSGPLKVIIRQACVVTLEPMESEIETEIDALFVPDNSKLTRKTSDQGANAMLIDPESDDAPETFTPPELDIGAVVHEFLALAIDPYPRSVQADEAVLGSKNPVTDDNPDEDKPNPFAILATLKNDGTNKG
ncbi:MAG: DUF177 domain-containing protein [Pseudomonadota bacterium]